MIATSHTATSQCSAVFRLLQVCLLVTVGLLFACSSSPKTDELDLPFDPNLTDEQLREEAARAYVAARKTLDGRDYNGAEQRYSFIAQRYPFTEFGTQAELERIFALYRMYEPERAITAADKFLREHPRHSRVDYVQYLKGLVRFESDPGLMGMLPIDSARADISDQRLAYDDFALVVQRYPDSVYAADARSRMVYLRNRIADHELNIVKFYVSRGAYLAAAKRAEQILVQYPGAPASFDALALMERSYREAGLQTHAADAEQVLLAQLAPEDAEAAQARSASWLQRLGSTLTFGLLGSDPGPDPDGESRDGDPVDTSTPGS